jgi:hypothetical protein
VSETAPAGEETRRWTERLVVVLVTFWAFVVALGLARGLEATGWVGHAAFPWALRLSTAGATVAAFLLAPRLGRRVPPRALAPLAVGLGVSLAVALGFLFVVYVIRAGG